VKRLGIGLVVIAVLTVAGTLVWRHRVSTDGPVFAGAGSEAGGRFDIGQPVSFGYLLLRTHGHTSATLERIRVLGITGGLDLLGIQGRSVPDNQGKGMFVSVFGYPPAEYPSQPLARQHVVPVARTSTARGEPNEGLELVIGVRATRPGVARARAIEVTYRAGGRRYRETYDGSMYLCAPKEQFTDENCPGDAHGKFDDISAEVKVP